MNLFKRQPGPADDLGLGIAGTLLLSFLVCGLVLFIIVWFVLPYLFCLFF